MRRRLVIFLMCLVLSVSLIVVACSSSVEPGVESGDEGENGEQQPIDITIGTGPAAGVYEIFGAAVSDIITREIPGARAGTIPGSAMMNIKFVADGEAELGVTHTSMIWDAWHGNWEPEYPATGTRAIMALTGQVAQIWKLADCDVEEVEDMVGKRVCPSEPGQAAFPMSEQILEVHGISLEDIEAAGGKVEYLSWSEMCDAMRDEMIDVGMWTTACPHPTMVDVTMTREIDLISLREDKAEELVELNPGFAKYTIPAGTYKHQEEDVLAVASVMCLITHEDVPEETIYQITKAIWENIDDFKSVYAGLNYINEDTVATSLQIPLHEGAKRYWDEVGIKVDEPVLVP